MSLHLVENDPTDDEDHREDLTDDLMDDDDGDGSAGVPAGGADDDENIEFGEGDLSGTDPLFPGDLGQLSLHVREAFVTVLKKRYISSESHPDEWRTVIESEAALQSRFNDMFLELVIDLDYEVAYKRQASSETGTRFPTLLHDLEWNREETILLVHARRLIRQSQQDGDGAGFVDRTDLVAEINSYRPPSTTNHVRDNRSANNAVDSLVKSRILLRTPEPDRYRISPIIEVLLPVARIVELAEWLRGQNGTAPDGEAATGAPEGHTAPFDLDSDGDSDPDSDPDGQPGSDIDDEQEPS